jgi:hypothetical protein
MGIRKKLEYV